MKMTLESNNLKDYLGESRDVDWSHLLIREKVEELYRGCHSEIDKVRRAFEFVRDEIDHSWDIESRRITRSASEVLAFKEGICYAKSNLLATLLRGIGIPVGFCYQRLILGDRPDTGYCIHALNGVYISELKRWIRLDARGNKEGIDAQFSIDEEILAFPIRPHYGEKDYPTIYVEPLKSTMETLKNNSDCLEMYKYGLPEKI